MMRITMLLFLVVGFADVSAAVVVPRVKPVIIDDAAPLEPEIEDMEDVETIVTTPAERPEDNRWALEIAHDTIDITVGYNGSTIEIFGDRRNTNTQVAIVVEGPRRDITMWQKARLLGTWVNRYFVTFRDMPIYYSYATSFEDFTPSLQEAFEDHKIGYDALIQTADVKTSYNLENLQQFQQEFMLKKQEAGVYFETPKTIHFVNDHFYRIRFNMPSSAPTGVYKIRSYLFKGDRVLDRQEHQLTVRQVGVNAFIYKAAHDYSFIYAVLVILCAFFFGWLVSVIRVRP